MHDNTLAHWMLVSSSNVDFMLKQKEMKDFVPMKKKNQQNNRIECQSGSLRWSFLSWLVSKWWSSRVGSSRFESSIRAVGQTCSYWLQWSTRPADMSIGAVRRAERSFVGPILYWRCRLSSFDCPSYTDDASPTHHYLSLPFAPSLLLSSVSLLLSFTPSLLQWRMGKREGWSLLEWMEQTSYALRSSRTTTSK